MSELLYIIGPVSGIDDDNRLAFRYDQGCLVGAGCTDEIPHDYIPSGTPHDDAMACRLISFRAANTRT